VTGGFMRRLETTPEPQAGASSSIADAAVTAPAGGEPAHTQRRPGLLERITRIAKGSGAA
jgi:hypothetical protein